MYRAVEIEGVWYVKNDESGVMEECESESRAVGKADLLNTSLKKANEAQRLKEQRVVHNQKVKADYRIGRNKK